MHVRAEERNQGVEDSRNLMMEKGKKSGRWIMSRRKTPKPEHRGPHDLRLWPIVDRLVTNVSGEVPVTQ